MRFAWPQYRELWSLTVEVSRLDGEARTPEADDVARRVRLDGVGAWTTAECSIALTTTETKPEGIDEIEAFALISSPRSNTRLPVKLESVDGGFAGRCTLHRASLAGAVEVSAQILTTRPVRTVGDTPSWTLVVDPSAAPTPPGVPPFVIAWEDFSSPDASQLGRASKESYAVMDLTGPAPVLRLNDGIKGFQSLLASSKARHERRRLRDAVGTSIARYAVSALLREASAQVVVEDDGTAVPPDDRLLRQVLDAVAAEAPGIASPDEFYLCVARPFEMTAVDRARFWAEVDLALDRLTNHAEYVASAVEEVRHA